MFCKRCISTNDHLYKHFPKHFLGQERSHPISLKKHFFPSKTSFNQQFLFTVWGILSQKIIRLTKSIFTLCTGLPQYGQEFFFCFMQPKPWQQHCFFNLTKENSGRENTANEIIIILSSCTSSCLFCLGFFGWFFLFSFLFFKKRNKKIKVINPLPRFTQTWFNTAGLSMYNYDFC